MQGFEKYYQKDWDERLAILKTATELTADELEILKTAELKPEIRETLIENQITGYTLPEGLALNYVVNGKEYLVPMVTEEPSVIAASSYGAKIVKQAGGFQTIQQPRLMLGQIIFEDVRDTVRLKTTLKAYETEIITLANQAHPSIVKRGGGARWIRIRTLSQDMLSLDLAVDVQEAMGANMLNTMLEAVAQFLKTELKINVLMSILSNYATECLVTAQCEIPVELLQTDAVPGELVAQKIVQANRVAQLDPYRATTHNKGIMNGIDAAVIASGNDWRAIESGAHAYASRHGQYRGLTKWDLKDNKLSGSLTLPMPLGFVGGAISVLPLAKINQKLLQIENANELAQVVVSVGLAQNLAALKALVTDGIQKGHMQLQLKTLAHRAGATAQETPYVVAQLSTNQKRDFQSAQDILTKLRKGDL